MTRHDFHIRPIAESDDTCHDDILGIFTKIKGNPEFLMGFYNPETKEVAMPTACHLDDIKKLIH